MKLYTDTQKHYHCQKLSILLHLQLFQKQSEALLKHTDHDIIISIKGHKI